MMKRSFFCRILILVLAAVALSCATDRSLTWEEWKAADYGTFPPNDYKQITIDWLYLRKGALVGKGSLDFRVDIPRPAYLPRQYAGPNAMTNVFGYSVGVAVYASQTANRVAQYFVFFRDGKIIFGKEALAFATFHSPNQPPVKVPIGHAVVRPDSHIRL